MYFSPQPDFVNTKVFLPPELQYQPSKKQGITLAMVDAEKQNKKVKKTAPEGCGPLGTECKVNFIFSFFFLVCENVECKIDFV